MANRKSSKTRKVVVVHHESEPDFFDILGGVATVVGAGLFGAAAISEASESAYQRRKRENDRMVDELEEDINRLDRQMSRTQSALDRLSRPKVVVVENPVPSEDRVEMTRLLGKLYAQLDALPYTEAFKRYDLKSRIERIEKALGIPRY